MNRKSGKSRDKQSVIDNEVSRLLRDDAHQISQSAMYKLREKYDDESLLDLIQDAFVEKSKSIRKKARKFARQINNKYGSQNFPLHILLRKALKQKKKMGLSDAEFEEFRRIYEQELTGTVPRSQNVSLSVPFTRMSQTLGQGKVDINDGMRLKDSDYGVLQNILATGAAKKASHAHVVLQSISYNDLAHEAMSGKFVNAKHNPYCHVHPIVAALFLPKIDLFENNMLIANLANIVKARYNKEPLLSKNDLDLFYNLISDPTDVVCSSESPVHDLHNRVNLQCTLWDSVVALRNGRYYDCSNQNFLASIDNCRRNTKDQPDLLYHNDEGSAMLRLLGAFSLRPTIVATTPLYNNVNVMHNRQNIVVPRVASLPMVTLRINPQTAQNKSHQYKLSDALNMSQWYVEDGIVVPRNQSIIYSKGALIFHVPRRAHTLNITKLIEPYSFTKLPGTTIGGFERINDRRVDYNHVEKIDSCEYKLRSVVILNINKSIAKNNGPRLVTGSSTVLTKHLTGGIQEHYWYNPSGAAVSYNSNNNNSWNQNNPVTHIRNYNTLGNLREGEYQKCSTRGTIFIYAQTRDVSLDTMKNIAF